MESDLLVLAKVLAERARRGVTSLGEAPAEKVGEAYHREAGQALACEALTPFLGL